MRRIPLVVIMGATGTGKTRLSLELAHKFGGEIIGADSMQMYKTLDIITAKASAEERKQVPHHLIDVYECDQIANVVDYRDRAIGIINQLFDGSKLPILVGGTNYYIEAILWKILLVEPDLKKDTFPKCPLRQEYENCNSMELHNKLATIDPLMASRLHPNNRRKIIRALEVWHDRGRKMSDILTEQQCARDASLLGGGLRFKHTCILHLHCDQKELNERLDARVDQMVSQGLINELTSFRCSLPRNYTLGILQSIGFKEFERFLNLDHDARNSEDGRCIFNECLKDLKVSTRRYARKQCSWIRNRLISDTHRQAPPIYTLDVTDSTKWEENVKRIAIDIVSSFIYDRQTNGDLRNVCGARNEKKINPNNGRTDDRSDISSHPNAQDSSHWCDICNRIFIGEYQWQTHRASNKHRRALHRQQRLKNQSVRHELDKKINK